MKRKAMDAAVFWLVIIGPVLIGLAGGIWYGGSRTFGLWAGFFGVVLLILAAALQLQGHIWKYTTASSDQPDIILLPPIHRYKLVWMRDSRWMRPVLRPIDRGSDQQHAEGAAEK